jgi:hypothetical protein
MYHPDRGKFDFVKVHDVDYLEKGDHIEVTSAVSHIAYSIPKDNIAYVSAEQDSQGHPS